MQMVGPLLHERDLYLAWSLKRSKAVDGGCSFAGCLPRDKLSLHVISPRPEDFRPAMRLRLPCAPCDVPFGAMDVLRGCTEQARYFHVEGILECCYYECRYK